MYFYLLICFSYRVGGQEMREEINIKILGDEQARNTGFVSDIISKMHKVRSIKSKFNDAYNSYAYEINDDFIVRFPRNVKSLDKLIRENKILEFLDGKITLDIPKTEVYQDGYFYTIHKKVHGDNITQNDLSGLSSSEKNKFFFDIANFVYELNSVTEEISEKIDIPRWDRLERAKKPREVLEYMLSDDRLNKNEKTFISNFYDKFVLKNDNEIIKFSHFDIMAKNLAFDFSEKKLNGIYDFGDCAIGDVYHDFSQIGLNYNLETLSEIVKHYEKLSGVVIDANRAWEYSLHSWLVFHNKYRTDITFKQLKEQLRIRME